MQSFNLLSFSDLKFRYPFIKEFINEVGTELAIHAFCTGNPAS